MLWVCHNFGGIYHLSIFLKFSRYIIQPPRLTPAACCSRGLRIRPVWWHRHPAVLWWFPQRKLKPAAQNETPWFQIDDFYHGKIDLKKKTMGKSMKTSIKQFYLITVYVEKWITENYDRLMGLPFTSQISGVSATSLTISGLKVNRRSPWQWSFVLGSCTKEGLGHVSKGICVWAIVCNSFWELLYVSAWLHQKLPGSSGSPLLLKHQIMPCAAPWWFWLRGAK